MRDVINELSGYDGIKSIIDQSKTYADSHGDVSDTFKKKASNSKSREEITYFFKDRGWKIIGNPGGFGTALEHPGYDYVLKLYANDGCYHSFISYVYKNPNQHFPKIIGKPIMIPKADNVGLVRLERLEELSMNEFYDIGLHTAINIVLPNVNYVEVVNDFKRENYPNEKQWNSMEYITKFDKNPSFAIKNPSNDIERDIANAAKWFLKRNKDLIISLKVLKQILPDACAVGIHEGNIMKRGNTLVINDPFRQDFRKK